MYDDLPNTAAIFLNFSKIIFHSNRLKIKNALRPLQGNKDKLDMKKVILRLRSASILSGYFI